jgi:hypothetical protein
MDSTTTEDQRPVGSGAVTEAVAARYEARAAAREMCIFGVYGSRPMFGNLRRAPKRRARFLEAHGGRDPLNAYAETAGRLADAESGSL